MRLDEIQFQMDMMVLSDVNARMRNPHQSDEHPLEFNRHSAEQTRKIVALIVVVLAIIVGLEGYSALLS